MPRSARIALIALGLLLLIGLLVPYLVNVDHFRPRIIAEVERRTGRKVEIAQLRARLLPTAGFRIDGVTLGPPPGFADVSLLTADSIWGSVALPKLLHGEVEVTSVEIVNPRVTLATDERRRTNYDFSTLSSGKISAAAPASSSRFVLDSLNFTGAELSLVEVRGRRVGPPSARISNLDLDLRGLDFSPAGMKSWEGDASLSGVKIEFAGLPPITFRSGSVKLERGAATGIGQADLGNVASVKGDFSIPDVEKGVLHFTLSTATLDLDRLVAAMPPSPKARMGGSGDPPARPAGRGELVAKGRITAGKLRWAPYEATNASADVRVFSDHIEMPAKMSLYGGSLGVNGRLDSATDRLSAGVQASQVDLEKLVAADPVTRGKLRGTGELKAQLAASLRGQLMNSLTGQGTFAVRDGCLPGVELGKSMAGLKKMEKFLSLGVTGRGSGTETRFSLVQGDMNIRDGRLYTNKTHADTNVGHGDMQGSVGLDQTVDITGTWHLTKSSRAGAATAGVVGATVLTGGVLAPVLVGAGGASLSVPFTVKGTLKDPKLTHGGGFKSSPSQSSDTTQQQKPPHQK